MLKANSQQLLHIIIGIALVTLLGVADSVRDVPAKTQFLVQIIAAIVITTAGIKINFIEIFGTTIQFDALNFTVQLGSIPLQFAPLADMITILWVVGLMNAINWVDGIDGLAAAISMFAALTLMFIGVKYEVIIAATMAALLFGGILGYFPFNFPPAKTYTGAVGVYFQGFMLAILAIISGAKLSTSLIVLALPIIDAVWVLFGRFQRNRRQIRSPLDLLKISDKTHLHHRLLDLGFTTKQTLAIEVTISLVFCVTAYYFAGFSQETVLMLLAVTVCLIFFSIVKVMQIRAERSKKALEKEAVKEEEVKVVTETPEEKYAY
jgi:UDP-GlcNAc:undecaprenyl-phosphate GlcNAc-1-phosphate transferase